MELDTFFYICINTRFVKKEGCFFDFRFFLFVVLVHMFPIYVDKIIHFAFLVCFFLLYIYKGETCFGILGDILNCGNLLSDSICFYFRTKTLQGTKSSKYGG